MATTTAFASMVSAKDNRLGGQCYVQPSDLPALEKEMSDRYGHDIDAFPDAWRLVRGQCKGALTKFVKNGEVPQRGASSDYTFPNDEQRTLLSFTLRYTSMGIAFAAVVASYKIHAVLLDIVAYRSMYLSEFGTTPPADLEACLQSRPDETEEASMEQQWLWQVGSFMAGCEKIIANCSGSTAIALSDTSLYLVWNSQSNPNDTKGFAVPVIPSGAEVRLQYSDYSVSETGARLWGGGVGLALLVAELATVLLTRSTEMKIMELGAGVALPTCVLARSAMASLALTGAAAADITLMATDCVPSILDCADKNISRQLSLGSAEHQSPPQQGDYRINTKTCLLDFFGMMQFQPDLNDEANQPWLPYLGKVDLLLATDIVYDMAIGRAGVLTMAKMLNPSDKAEGTSLQFSSLDEVLESWRNRSIISGGIAILCCESHRDAMPCLPAFLSEAGLTVLWHTKDIQSDLRYYTLPKGTTTSRCELYVLVKFADSD